MKSDEERKKDNVWETQNKRRNENEEEKDVK